MIKFTTLLNGNMLVGFGLSEENIRRLKEGMPIYIKPEMVKQLFGTEGSVVIFYGETEKTMIGDLLKAGFDLPEEGISVG